MLVSGEVTLYIADLRRSGPYPGGQSEKGHLALLISRKDATILLIVGGGKKQQKKYFHTFWVLLSVVGTRTVQIPTCILFWLCTYGWGVWDFALWLKHGLWGCTHWLEHYLLGFCSLYEALSLRCLLFWLEY